MIIDEPFLTPAPTPPRTAPAGLSMSHALRVQSAEYWLKLGEPGQALAELGHLPKPARRHPRVLKMWISALGAARRMRELSARGRR